MAKVTIKYDIRKAEKKLKEAKQFYTKKGEDSVNILARMGQAYAKSIVPRDTGKTANLIKVFSGTDSEGPYAKIIAQNPTANDGHFRQMKNFNLVRWMHTSPKAASHIRTGDERFMFTMAERMQIESKRVVRQLFNEARFK